MSIANYFNKLPQSGQKRIRGGTAVITLDESPAKPRVKRSKVEGGIEDAKDGKTSKDGKTANVVAGKPVGKPRALEHKQGNANTVEERKTPATGKPGDEGPYLLAAMLEEACAEWYQLLSSEFRKPYMRGLQQKLNGEVRSRKKIFPPLPLTFRAFKLSPLAAVNVVILGQDPYHNTGQAEGLCFSVPRGVAVPSSLRNMYKELASCQGVTKSKSGFRKPNHGHLVKWAQQGVLLLNTALTVRAHQPASHKKYGWHQFTDAVIRTLSRKAQHSLCFVLWGNHARSKKKLVDGNRHTVLESVHPSGLSAHRGFIGSRVFQKINEWLRGQKKEPIDWQV